MRRHAIFLLFGLVLFFGLSFADIGVAGCMGFNGPAPDTYLYMATPRIDAPGDCFGFNNSGDFTFDCRGGIINYTGGAGEFSAFYLENVTRVVLKNCILTNWNGVGAIASRAIELVNVSNSTLLNISINNSGSGIRMGEYSNNITVRDCNFTNMIDYGVWIQDDVDDILIEKSFFDMFGETAITARYMDNLTVQHNIIWNVTINGIYVFRTAYIYNNTIRNCSSSCILNYYPEHSRIGGNTIFNSKEYAIRLDNRAMSDDEVYSNSIYFSEGGIGVWEGRRVSIYDNTILSSTGNAIYLSRNEESEVYNNAIRWVDGASGIRLSSGANNLVYGNTLRDINRTLEFGIYAGGESDSQIYGNTIFDLNGTGVGLNNCHNVSVTGNTVHDAELGYYDEVAVTSLNTFDSNAAYNVKSGFYFTESNDLTATNNLAYNCSKAAMRMYGCPNATVVGNTLRNSSAGLDLTLNGDDSDSYFGDNIFYDNGVDLSVSVTGPTTSPLFNMSNSVFRNPAGSTSTGYTTLSIVDLVRYHGANGGPGGWERFEVTWTELDPLAVPPNGLSSFRGKSVLISSYWPYFATLDYLQWSWSESETSGYDEGSLQVWEYGIRHGWFLINTTRDTGANTLTTNEGIYAAVYTYGIFGNTTEGGDGDGDGDGDEPECTRDSQCPDCYRCTIEDRCAPKSESECYSAFENYPAMGCKTGYTCTDCVCIPECTRDADCDPGFTCEDGECIPPDCIDDGDCPSGYECEDYECVKEKEPEPEPEPEKIPEGLPPAEPEKEPPFIEPEEIAKDVVPLVSVEPEEQPDDLWETVIRGAWVLLFILIIVAFIYALFSRRKKREAEEE